MVRVYVWASLYLGLLTAVVLMVYHFRSVEGFEVPPATVMSGKICYPDANMCIETKDNRTTFTDLNGTPTVQQSDSVQIGDKYQIKAQNDLLMVGAWDGANIMGGVGVNNLHTYGESTVDGSAVFKGGISEHNPDGRKTHFPWKGNNQNYIRGDTEIRGNTNNIGDMNVGRDLRVNRNANLQGRIIFGANNTDPYYMEKVIGGRDSSHLRLTINDNPQESFQIWGNSCQAGNCQGEGSMQHHFDARGNATHKGNVNAQGLCINGTCLRQQDIQTLLDMKNQFQFQSSIPSTQIPSQLTPQMLPAYQPQGQPRAV